jgi:hypothetical protein
VGGSSPPPDAAQVETGRWGAGESDPEFANNGPVRYASHMKKAAKEPEMIIREGKPVSVILPIKEYEKLLERLEDAEDAAYLKKARSKPLSFTPLGQYLAERKKTRV